jgi:hypothetical protein
LLQSLDLNVAPHDMSHYLPGDRMEASKKRDATRSQLLSELLDKLKSVQESEGSRLFDHTSVVYGSNIRSIHFLDNCPTLLSGGGSSIKLGQHVVLPKHTPLANVWLTLLQRIGIDTERHGDSTGDPGTARIAGFTKPSHGELKGCARFRGIKLRFHASAPRHALQRHFLKKDE